MVAQATGQPTDTSIFIFKNRGDAEDAPAPHQSGSRVAPLPGSLWCTRAGEAAAGQDRLDPQRRAGQKLGLRWKEDAPYDLGFAVKVGGPAAVAAATVGTKLLLPEKVDMPYLVREVGPELLEIPQAESEIPGHDPVLSPRPARGMALAPAVADSAFLAYQASGGSPDRAALELAWMRLAASHPGADSLYYRAAAAADSGCSAIPGSMS